MTVADLVAKGKRMSQVVLEFTAKNLTGFAGLVPFHEFVTRLGVEKFVNERLKLRRVGDVYSNGRMVVALVYGFVLGLLRLRGVALLGLDRVLLKALGWASFPVQSTFSLFLRRFDAKAVASLGKINLELLERFRHGWKGFRRIHLDLDSHVRTVYGETLEGAERGYNPKKRGRRSYHPLVAFVGETRDFLWGRFRPGNNTTRSMVGFLRECLRVLGSRFTWICVRADSGFCFQEFLTALEEKGVGYIIALRMYPHHQLRFAGLEFRGLRGRQDARRSDCLQTAIESALPVVSAPAASWALSHLASLAASRVLEGPEAEESIQCAEYLSTDWPDRKRRRIVVLREPVPDKASGRRVTGKQLKLFELQGYAYRAYVTNLTAPPEAVWREYNGRASCENHIKEAIDLGLDVNASQRYQANAAHFQVVMMAYNLQNWYKEVGLGDSPPGHGEEAGREDAPDSNGGRQTRPAGRKYRRRRRRDSVKPTSKWVRCRLFWIPGVLVRSARQFRLKLPKDWPWRDLLDHVVTRVLAWQPVVA